MTEPNAIIDPQNTPQPNGGQPNPTPNPAPQPQGGTSVSMEQLSILLNNARKEEKDKLYPEITSLKEQLKNATVSLKELQEQHKQVTQTKEADELKATIESLKEEIKQLKEDTKVNPQGQNPPNQQQTPQTNAELDALKQQLAEMKTLLENQSKITAEAQAQQIRAKLIAEANGQIIPELVTGTTEDEIKASIEKSKQVYQNVYQQASAQAVAIPPANPVGDMTLPADLSLDQIQNMDMKDWADYRNKLGLR